MFSAALAAGNATLLFANKYRCEFHYFVKLTIFVSDGVNLTLAINAFARQIYCPCLQPAKMLYSFGFCSCSVKDLR